MLYLNYKVFYFGLVGMLFITSFIPSLVGFEIPTISIFRKSIIGLDKNLDENLSLFDYDDDVFNLFSIGLKPFIA